MCSPDAEPVANEVPVTRVEMTGETVTQQTSSPVAEEEPIVNNDHKDEEQPMKDAKDESNVDEPAVKDSSSCGRICLAITCVLFVIAGAFIVYVLFKPGVDKERRDSAADVLKNIDTTNMTDEEAFRNFLPLTKEKWALISHAIKRNQELYKFDLVPEGVQVHDYHNHTDRMYTEEYLDKYCMVTWMGTDSGEGDWDQNFNSEPKEIGDDKCVVHEGLWQAYSGSGTGDSQQFVPVLTEFVERCDAAGKQLVFSGHSQGGGAAGIAHILFKEYKPISIGFGSPPFFYEETLCNGILPKHHGWRFINSENRDDALGARIVYDVIANINLVETIDFVPGHHFGGYIVLPPGKEDGTMVPYQESVAYFGPDKPDMNLGVYNLDVLDGSGYSTGSAHPTFGYRDKIEALLASLEDGETLDPNGFIDGTMCLVDKECQTFNTLDIGGCVDDVCSAGKTGDTCENDSQCASGRCEMDGLPFDGQGLCYDQLEAGEGCNADSDCKSGSCSWFTCD